jgi:CelD/BcsL family acetyltransferase involved in cellulose biosynthesis
MTRVSVEEVRSAAALSDHRPVWAELAAVAPGGELFETPAWIESWLSAYWHDRPLAFLFIREDGDLIGLAPLLDDAEGRIGCRRSLVTPVNPHARRCAILARENRFPDVLGAVTSHLEQTRRGHRLRLRCADAASQAVIQIGAGSSGSLIRDAGASPIIRIEGTWDDYLSGRSRHLRRELIRKKRKLEAHWDVAWTTADEEHERAMTDVLVIERNSWKEREGTSICAEEGAAPFYAKLARACAAEGWLRIETLRLDGHPVAHILGVSHRGVYYALKTSYDEAFRSWAPGLVLFQYVIERCFAEGLTTFDFLGDPSRWKSELANETRHHVDACSFASDALRCRWDVARHTRIKPFLETHAPALLDARRRVKEIGRGADG